MHTVIVGVFAHPDDETAGPSATFMKQIDDDAELHLICVTDGSHGANPDNEEDIAETRLQEWQSASAVIGATTLYPLRYEDGSLCNQLYHEIADIIEAIVRDITADRRDIDLQLVTFDTTGMTGHLDHIAVSYITTYVFQQLKLQPIRGVETSSLAYFCLSRQQQPASNSEYVYMPRGRDDEYINRRVDVSAYYDRKCMAMREHVSQRSDMAYWQSLDPSYHATDNFRVITDVHLSS